MAKFPSSLDFLDRLARKIGASEAYPGGVATDYRLAQVLGISKQAVSDVRKKRTSLGSPTALKVAELLGEEAGYVLACVQVERTQDAAVRKVWEKVAGGAAVVVLSMALFAAPYPTAGAGGSDATDIYIMRRKRPRAQRFRPFAPQGFNLERPAGAIH